MGGYTRRVSTQAGVYRQPTLLGGAAREAESLGGRAAGGRAALLRQRCPPATPLQPEVHALARAAREPCPRHGLTHDRKCLLAGRAQVLAAPCGPHAIRLDR